MQPKTFSPEITIQRWKKNIKNQKVFIGMGFHYSFEITKKKILFPKENKRKIFYNNNNKKKKNFYNF